MMTPHCPSPEDLSAFHDGELPPDARVSVAEHLASCAACAAARERLERASRLLAALPREPASEQQVREVAARAAAASVAPGAEGRAGGPPRWLLMSLPLVTAASVLVGTFIVLRQVKQRARREMPAVMAARDAGGWGKKDRAASNLPAAEAASPAEAPAESAAAPATPEAEAPAATAEAPAAMAEAPAAMAEAPAATAVVEVAAAKAEASSGFAPEPRAQATQPAAPEPAAAVASLKTASAEPRASKAPASAERAAFAAAPPASAPTLGDDIRDEPASPATPMRITDEITAPRLLERVEPAHPVDAAGQPLVGQVTLECVVDQLGRVSVSKTLRSAPGLDAAAIAAVTRWRYAPALREGRPQAVFLVISIPF